MKYKWFHDLFFEPSDEWEDWQLRGVRNATLFIAGFLAVILLLGLVIREEPQQPIDGRPWNEILTPEQRGRRPNSYKPGRQITTTTGTSEDKLIEKLSNGDYHDHSDYNGGMDGEHSDIDYSEVEDYFRD